jgi:hypothetical protein
MRRSLVIMMAVLGFGSVGLVAQSSEVPAIDVYGAYSHSSNFDIGQNGWLASVNYNIVPPNLGLEADVSGGYGTKSLGTIAVIVPGVPNEIRSRIHSFNLGPRYTFHPSSTNDAEAFGHLLFGFSHTNVGATEVSDADTSYSWVLGGGGDYFFTPHVGGRAQIDLLRTNFFGHGDNHARIAIGVVFRFRTSQ